MCDQLHTVYVKRTHSVSHSSLRFMNTHLYSLARITNTCVHTHVHTDIRIHIYIRKHLLAFTLLRSVYVFMMQGRVEREKEKE